MARNPVIDLLRGWAIVGMTIWHFVMWFGHTRCDVAACTPELNGLWHALFYNGSSLSVPLFYFTAGMTLALNLERHRGPQVAARAVQVILLGYALTFFVMGPDQWLHAFVLQSIGFGLLLMAVFSLWHRGAMALYLIALAATLYNLDKSQVLVPSVAARESMLPVLIDGIRALVIDGGFALLPWSGFIALGFGMCRLSLNMRRPIALFGVMALAAGALLGIAKYPMSPGYLLFFSGIAVLAVLGFEHIRGGLAVWLDGSVPGRAWTRLSRHSLEVFVIHYVLGHGAAVMFPAWRLSFGAAVGLGLIFLLLAAAVLAFFDQPSPRSV